MNKEKRYRLHRITGILCACATVIAGLCLAGACIYIFLSGDKPFTRESISHAFSYIQIPVYISLALIAIGFLLDLFHPLDEEETLTGDQPEMALERLRYRRDPSLSETDVTPELLKLRKTARLLKVILGIVITLETAAFTFIVIAIGLFERGSNSSADITENVLCGLLIMLPFAAIALGLAIVFDKIKLSLIRKETAVLNSTPAKKGKRDRSEDEKREKKKNTVTVAVRIAVLLAALSLMIYGYIIGGYSDVLAKAVAICTECIGLG